MPDAATAGTPAGCCATEHGWSPSIAALEWQLWRMSGLPDEPACLIAERLGVTEQDVIDMNRRLGGDASLNMPIREDGDSGEWQDWLVTVGVAGSRRTAPW